MITSYGKYKSIQKLNEAINTDVRDKNALTKIRNSFTQIMTNLGFFTDLLFKLNIVEAYPNSGVDTMATDGKSIVYSPEFVNSLAEDEVSFVIIHEIMHNANFHFARQSGRDHDLWNEAADYAINIQIDDMAKELPRKILKAPKKILLDDKYRNMSAEQIYDILKKDQKAPSGGGGTPQNDIRKPGSLDKAGTKVVEGSKDMQESGSSEELEGAWSIARKVAGNKNIGTGSASMDRWIKKINKPKVNWKTELKKFISSVYDDKDYAYFNKNYIYRDMYLSGVKNVDTDAYDNVVIAIDTSGSITEDTLAKFATELFSIFKIHRVQTCHVIWCDAEIPKDGVQTFNISKDKFSIEKLKPKGGGGTSFLPPFEWVQKNILKKGKVPAFFIYFTDAAGTAPTVNDFDIKRYSKRILWVITETETAPNITFGKKLFIDKILTN